MGGGEGNGLWTSRGESGKSIGLFLASDFYNKNVLLSQRFGEKYEC